MPEQTCAFTGHRAGKLPWGYNEEDPRALALKQRLLDTAECVYDAGARLFLCGMAQGCDLYFCEAVLLLRETRSDMRLEAVIPFAGQSDRWPAAERRRYDRLCAECDRRTVLRRDYSPDCMMARNRHMVERADVLIACYNGQSGGTLNTLRYAISRGVQVIQLQAE